MEQLRKFYLSILFFFIFFASLGQNAIKDKEYYLKKAFSNPQTSEKFRTAIDSGLKVFPNDSQLWRENATSYFKAAEYAPAMQYINKAVELDTLRWLGYRGFMKCIFMKDYKNALIDFQNIYKKKPIEQIMDHSFPFWIGLCYLKLNQLDSARRFLNVSINQAQKNGADWVHFNERFYSAICYSQAQKYDLALKEFDETLRLSHSFSDAQYYKSKILLLLNRKQEAIELLNQANENAAKGYTINEDNVAYLYYPFQVTTYEINTLLNQVEK
jgi:tetratricopeptide (TPR) repeat protein